MQEDIRRGIVNDRNEANAAARAKAIAYNKNWNIIYFPGATAGDASALENSANDPHDLGDFLRRASNDDETEATAAASGKAVICNRNTNIVIYE